MFLLNLSLAEFLAVFSGLSAGVIALYLLARTRRRQRVATLRFWAQAGPAANEQRQRRIQQPVSLVLQLLGLALLLLAIARMQIGSPSLSARDHILLFDASSWAVAEGLRGPVIEELRRLARAYVRNLPAADRLMLLRVDAAVTPLGGWETDREKIEEAIRRIQPSDSALRLEQALLLAQQIRRLQSRRPGEIVFVGIGRTEDRDFTVPENLRVLLVDAPVDNRGIRKLTVRHMEEAGAWEVYVAVRNSGARMHTARVQLDFGGAVVGLKEMTLKPGQEAEARFLLRTTAAGLVRARLLERDALAADNQAAVEIPSRRPVRVAVFTNRPEALRPILQANPQIEPVFLPQSKYRAETEAPIVILDRFTPQQLPRQAGVLVIEPPPSPHTPVREVVRDAVVVHWGADGVLSSGLRSREFRLQTAQIFRPAPGDIPVAESAQGPVVVARPDPRRLVYVGFDPSQNSARYELVTPLLFANLLRWLDSRAFRVPEVMAQRVGPLSVQLDREYAAEEIRVLNEAGSQAPFRLQGRMLTAHIEQPSTVRILTPEQEFVYSATLPDVAEQVWRPPETVARGIPPRSVTAAALDAWPYLAGVGGLVLMLEFLLFGPQGRKRRTEWRQVVGELRKAS